MFFTIFMPVGIRKIAVILLLVVTTLLLPNSSVFADEEIPPSLTSVVESPVEVDAEIETIEPLSEEEIDTEIETIKPLSEEEIEILPEESLVEPTAQLTPEQALILALQARITELTGSYNDERVESIQMNLSEHLLQVKVKPDWYQLEEQEQDEMAQKLFNQAKSLAFTKLELVNYQGQLIARNPVIGKQMIILDRHQD